MKHWKLFGVAAMAMLALAGCGSQKEEVTVRYLNFKPEVADVWQEIAEKYTEETGIKVEILTAPSNCNEQTLKAEIAKKNAPTLFQINGPVGYATWKNYCINLADTDLYSWVIDKDMCITGADGGVYGIPYVVEGYGIIYNDEIMQRYFSLPNKGTAYASMNEINNFKVLSEVTEDMTKHKAELGIEGVFACTSFQAGEEWRWQTHLMNLPIYLEYQQKGVDDLDALDFTYGKNFKNIFDLYLNNSTVAPSEIGNKTVTDSMTEFATGKCAMVQNGNWAWTQIASAEGNVVKKQNCKYLPIYTGAQGEESQGICIGTECYMAVSALASEEAQKASIDFMEWVFSSDFGKDYLKNRFQFITVFNTLGDADLPENPLAQEVSAYINDSSKASVSWNFTTFPGQNFKDELSNQLFLYATGEQEFNLVEDYVVQRWKEEKSGQ